MQTAAAAVVLRRQELSKGIRRRMDSSDGPGYVTHTNEDDNAYVLHCIDQTVRPERPSARQQHKRAAANVICGKHCQVHGYACLAWALRTDFQNNNKAIYNERSVVAIEFGVGLQEVLR